MKMLVVFLLAVLGCSLAEGTIVSKCELRDQLKNVTGDLTVQAKPSGLTVEDIVAKLVCHAELGSGFNTSAVKKLTGKEAYGSAEQAGRYKSFEEDEDESQEHEEQTEDHRKSSVEDGDENEEQTKDNHKSSEDDDDDDDDDSEEDEEQTNQPHVRDRRHDKGPPAPTRTAGNCTLYGIFQLSSCLACNDSVTPSVNACGIPCSNLLDDDTSDDVSCLLTIIPVLGDRTAQFWEVLEGVISEETCEDTRASSYFSECSSS